jgi:hypothetical protein
MKDGRELFTWTDEQRQLADRLCDMLAEGERAVQIEALLDSVASFILVTYLREPLSYRLMEFLAVLSIDRDISRMRTTNTTRLCSRLLCTV